MQIIVRLKLTSAHIGRRPPPLPLSAPCWRRRHRCHGCRVVATIATVAIAAATVTAAAISAATSTVSTAIATTFWLIVVCPCAASALATAACPCRCRHWLPTPLPLSPCSRKPLPPAPSAATARCSKYYIKSNILNNFAATFWLIVVCSHAASATALLPTPTVAAVGCRDTIATVAAAANRCPLLLPPQPCDVQNITFKVIF